MLWSMSVAAVVMAAALALQPAAPGPAAYLDVLRQYGPKTERAALLALVALELDKPQQVFTALDRACQAQGARSCAPRDLPTLKADVRARVIRTWQQLYPRVLAVHVEALAASDPVDGLAAHVFHRAVLVRLNERLEDIARRPDATPEQVMLAATGRHLLVWALQYARDDAGLAAVLDAYAQPPLDDADLRLARASLEELRSMPEAVSRAARSRESNATGAPLPIAARRRQEEARRLDRAARAYLDLIATDAAGIEPHLRLSRVLARQAKWADAEAHGREVLRHRPDARQAYLAALFVADAVEQQGRAAEAQALYVEAQRLWPGAQAPAVSLARLRTLAGAPVDARAALAVLEVEESETNPFAVTSAVDRSDPWAGYHAAQAWRLGPTVEALQQSFVPMP